MSSSHIKGRNPSNNKWEAIGKDSLTSTLRTIEIEHALSHDGKAFVCTTVASVASTGHYDILLVNPTSNFPHLRFWDWEATGAPGTIELYEGPFTGVGTGTFCPLNVTNRTMSSNLSSLSVYIASSLTLNASLSTLLEDHVLSGAKQSGGTQEGTAMEWILNENTNYLMRINNDSGGAISAGFFMFILQPEDS